MDDEGPAKRRKSTTSTAQPTHIPGALPMRRVSNNLPIIYTLSQQLQVSCIPTPSHHGQGTTETLIPSLPPRLSSLFCISCLAQLHRFLTKLGQIRSGDRVPPFPQLPNRSLHPRLHSMPQLKLHSYDQKAANLQTYKSGPWFGMHEDSNQAGVLTCPIGAAC